MRCDRAFRALRLAGALALLTGCNSTQSADTPPASETISDVRGATSSGSPAADFTMRVFPPGEAWDEAVQPLIVRVSNQAFDDPDVQLSANLDGVILFDQTFKVEDQHTVTLFGVNVAPGSHTLTVLSDTGAKVEQPFDLTAGKQRWVVVNYWYFDPNPTAQRQRGQEEEPGPSLHVSISDQPVYIG
ncbi:MAG: hypothetical protein DCC50_00550 [Acidobacteria bacterium]|nr:MAG: hypothetical protein DCC50_00550 [Acidobacteriota bacterium]